ncbi:hypothetical protein K501DRAFT_227258 [Backusella circina FSU 941]|nr:hypothetical protein K501DRAFT_227258 [Backusella circina FSU 941]
MFKRVFPLLFFIHLVKCFYLPGVAPHDYQLGEKVDLNVNSIQSVISYDYYYERIHLCAPKEKKQQPESIGSVLFGDRIFNSPFELYMQQNTTCEILCETPIIPKKDATFINTLIRENYMMHWEVDGLPVSIYNNSFVGFNMGFERDGVAYLNNHYDIMVYYHQVKSGAARVVGAMVKPRSQMECGGKVPFRLEEDGKDRVSYTYSVKWMPSDTVWATRWDVFLHVSDPSIHWFSLVNSIIIILFLTGMLSLILVRALHKDISRYNAVDAQEDAQEDYGWKLVHGDVFRPPSHNMMLSVLTGSGLQLVAMTGLTLVFSILGFLSPSNRGSLATVMLILFMVFSGISGYTSARCYKMNNGERWKFNIFLSAVLLPGMLLGGLIGLNFFLIYSEASGAVPFSTMLAIIGLWCIISLPLSVVGSYVGLRTTRISHPVRTNQIPRQIPDQPLLQSFLPSILMGGILPFGAIFIELYFIMNSIWFHRIYYGIGFLFLVFGVLLVTCSQVAVLMCYFHLCNEDYHWSWRSFLTSGATGFYVYLYSFIYYFTRLNINSFASTVLYFGYSSMLSILLAIMTGAIGYLSCLYFLRKIFASIKVD